MLLLSPKAFVVLNSIHDVRFVEPVRVLLQRYDIAVVENVCPPVESLTERLVACAPRKGQTAQDVRNTVGEGM